MNSGDRLVYSYYGQATGETVWFERADAVIKANLSLFAADGRASAVHVYPFACDGRSAAANDPWANDQDWALVSLLVAREIHSGDRLLNSQTASKATGSARESSGVA